MGEPINKVKVNLKNLTKLMEDLNSTHDIRVGIVGDKAFEIHEGSGLTNAQLGAVHEFGATINHPGGQPYYYDEETGLCKFVKKDSELGRKLIAKGQVTKAHTIYIPTRSFLRMPLLSSEGKRFITNFAVKALKREYGKDFEELFRMNTTTKDFLGKEIANKIALGGVARVLDAFETGGFGNWAKPTAATLANRKSNAEPNPLLDTGQLRDSISATVDGDEAKENGSLQGAITYGVIK